MSRPPHMVSDSNACRRKKIKIFIERGEGSHAAIYKTKKKELLWLKFEISDKS